MGSEMCIRDSLNTVASLEALGLHDPDLVTLADLVKSLARPAGTSHA